MLSKVEIIYTCDFANIKRIQKGQNFIYEIVCKKFLTTERNIRKSFFCDSEYKAYKFCSTIMDYVLNSAKFEVKGD